MKYSSAAATPAFGATTAATPAALLIIMIHLLKVMIIQALPFWLGSIKKYNL